MERLAAWLLTKAGRNFVYFGTGILSSGVVLLKLVPNTILLEEYKDLVHFYKKGLSLPLSKELYDRFNRAVDLCKIPQDYQHLYTPFHVIGFEVFSAGTTYSRYGVIVGLPINFTYKDVDSIENKSDILIEGETVAWGTPESEKFLKSLVLSEDAQLYAMAKEIKERDSNKILFETFYTMFPLPMYYGLTTYINKRYDLYTKPLALRLLMYGFAGTLIATYYFFLKDLTQVHYEQKIDKELKDSNKIFVEGGKEYYTKMMARNQALRALLGKSGERKFTVMGNENYFIRQKHLPLSDRKSFFEEALTN